MTIDFAALKLLRYPGKHAKELRAWDAADEYLSDFLAAEASVVLVNDAFGALHCAAESKQAKAIYHINDSWCSQKAITVNARQQAFSRCAGQYADLALVKIPKSLSLLAAQLQKLSSQIDAPLTLYFSGMQKHVSNGHLDAIKAQCAEVEYLPTQRKARMYKAVLNPETDLNAQLTPFVVPIPELEIELHNVAGVFAEQKIDIGSRFFIEHFDRLPAVNSVADVGCGNGLLSLAYHRLHPAARLSLFDESLAAVESARMSFSHNAPDALVTITHHDGLADIEQKFDLILINPPFHQQNTVTTDIALSMFEQARACLNPDGELWIVANRHLNYQKDLKRWFKRIESVAQNAKFVIIKAMK
ncbi:class I SAM-dependent methyltransferase [Chitinibacter sp. S2-10]|uniref:class I SAM-dependent methyltransferase n=1 Tax=Chitinibacter sp. S2-10 TaxID=3373597 RepID=UPI0039779114